MCARVGTREASLRRTAVRVLGLALPLFFAWEMAQAPAFTGMPEDWVSATTVCALAALGDGVIVLALWGAGGLLFGDPRWFAPPTLRRYAAIVLVGIGVQVLVEWVMVNGLGRWGYGPGTADPAGATHRAAPAAAGGGPAAARLRRTRQMGDARVAGAPWRPPVNELEPVRTPTAGRDGVHRSRPLRRVLLGVGALLMLPASAGAHAGLVASTPSPGIGLPQAPGAVVLRFSEPLNPRLSRIGVVDRTGREVTVGPTLPVEGDPRAMRRKLDLLSPGQYTVRWITVSTRDGHTRQGTYTFGIATASPGNERIENSPVASEGWLGLVGRFAALVGLGLWAGFSLLNPVAARAGVPERRAHLLGRLGPLLTLAGTSVSVVSSTLVATGSVARLGELLLTGRPGWLRAGLIAASAAGVLVGAARQRLGRLFMAGALVAESGAGHSASASWPMLATASFAVHLAAAGVWVFAILAAVLSSGGVVKALATFSPYAIGAAALVGMSGLVNTGLELTRPEDLWSTGYGQAVLGKAGMFVAMACLGFTHFRRRRRPGVRPSEVERPLRLELGAAGLALGLAAVLVSFPNPPREAKSAEPLAGLDPVLAHLAPREALSVAGPSGPFIVGLTLLPPRPGAVEVRLQVIGLEAGDAPRDARVRGHSDGGSSLDVPLVPCERGFGCFTGLAGIDGFGLWRFETFVKSNRGPIVTEARLTLPAAEGSAELARATAAMEGLRSARLHEQLRGSVDGPLIVADYRFRAPDAFEIAIAERRQIVIGERVFGRSRPSDPWSAGPWPVAFTWPKDYYREFWQDAAAVRIIGAERVDGVPSNIVAFVRPKLPAWFRLWVGASDGLVRRREMLAQGHIMEHTYHSLNEPLDLRPPL